MAANNRVAEKHDGQPKTNGAPQRDWLDSLIDMLPQRPIRWDILRAQCRYWLWQIATKAVLSVVYFAVIAEGLRMTVPALGLKLHKTPGLTWLYDYEATHRLDLAHLLAVFLLIGVWTLWRRILELWLGNDDAFYEGRWHVDNHKRLVVALGGLILAADAALFSGYPNKPGQGSVSDR